VRNLLYFFITLSANVLAWGVYWPNQFDAFLIVIPGASFIVVYFFVYFVWLNFTKNSEAKIQAITVAARAEAKTRFLAHMSHEIRTPVTTIMGVAEIQLNDMNLEPKVRDAFLNVYSMSNTLTGILNSILDLSKIDAGKMEIMQRPYHISTLLSKVTQLHAVALENKKFRFKVKVDENLPRNLVGDELRIQQVLGNLLSNSFKYTETGIVKFTASVEPTDRDDYINLILTVEDTGFGMTDEQVQIILQDDYTRFYDSDRLHIQGTGLGISIVQKLLSLMGGIMTIESTLNKGTKVRVCIPQKKATNSAVGADAAERLENFNDKPENIVTQHPKLPWAKVLVVDDMDLNLVVAKGLLELYEINVETCTTANEAINKIKSGCMYDIIFMDHMMPDMDGIAGTEIIREMGYDRPIIALTANAFEEQKQEFLASGFDEFLAKPIKTDLLQKLLLKFINPSPDSDL